MACGDLIQSSVLDCNNILQAGVGDSSRLVLILKDDITSYTTDANGVISAITLASGKSAFSFDGIKQSLKPKFERQSAPSGQSVYRHSVTFFYFEYSQIAKNNLAQMANGRYVAIYANAKQDSNAYEILGTDVGLEMTECMRAPQENGGAISVTLSSPEGEFESRPPRTLFVTSWSATHTLVNGYIHLPTIGNSGLSVTAASISGGTALTVTGTNFFGGGVNDAVTAVDLVNQTTGAVINRPSTTSSNTSLSLTGGTPPAVAGVYKIRVTTTKGVALSPQNLIIS
jgi:hypothetical protein